MRVEHPVSGPSRRPVPSRRKNWTYVVDVGVDPVSGKRRQRTRGGFATKKEAEAALREMLGTVEVGTYASTTGLSAGEYLAGWIETTLLDGRTQVRATTGHGYNKARR